MTRDRGFNIIGYLSAASGLGEAGRNTARSLEEAGYPFACLDVRLRRPVTSEVLPEAWAVAGGPRELPYGVDVFHINPDALQNELFSWRRAIGLDVRSTVNAVVPFWELSALPTGWIPILGSMDMVLAPTRFVMDAVTAGLEEPRPEVWHYPQTVYAPEQVVRDRSRWFPEAQDATVFLCSFDVSSDIERKNPQAVISAFRAAFGGRADVLLVLKANGAGSQGPHTAKYDSMRQATGLDHRIRWMTEPLDRADLWSLHASADALVSLHRSEGLGLGLMESMAVGCPVVATGWSGNMDFMDDEVAIVVPYRLVPVAGATLAEYSAHGPEQLWAEPDVEAAAVALRTLADDAGLRRRLGLAGRERIQALHRDPRRRAPLERLLELADEGVASGEAHRDRVRRLEAAADTLAFRRGVVRALRAVGLKPGAAPDSPPVFVGKTGTGVA